MALGVKQRARDFLRVGVGAAGQRSRAGGLHGDGMEMELSLERPAMRHAQLLHLPGPALLKTLLKSIQSWSAELYSDVTD